MKTYEAIGTLLHRAGSDTVHALLGSANAAWIGYGVESGMLQLVHARHEVTTVAAAAAHARVRSEVGIASTTMGPGFANAINSLAAAVHSHIPVLLIVGQSPSSKMHGDFQTLNQREITAAIGAGFHSAARPEELEDAFWSAWSACQRNGTPQVLSIDEAILDKPIQLGDGGPPVTEQHDQGAEEIDPDAVAAVTDLLSRSGSTLILAGQGAALADCRAELLELADLTGAYLASTLGVHRFFAGDPRDLGVCGSSASPLAAEHLGKAEVVLAVGASLNSYTLAEHTLFPAARIVQCEIDENAKAKASAPEYALLGDARTSIRALIEHWHALSLAPHPAPEPAPDWAAMQDSIRRADLGHDPARGLDLREVCTLLDRRLPADRIVVMDGGRASIPVPALMNAPDHHSWLSSRGYGSIGLGIPAAIGAAAAAPERRIVLICGDGGFMMSAQELDTIRLHGLQVLIVILNDEQYGSEVKYLRRIGADLAPARYTMPDIEQLAAAFGGTGQVIRTLDELAAAPLDGPGLTVLDVRLDPEVDPANL